MLKEMKYLKSYIVGLFGMCTLAVSAASPSITAKLDSASLLMGKLGSLHLEVVQDANAKGGFPMLAVPAPEGYLPLCGDSVELRTSYKADTIDIGSGRRQINFTFPIQSFDSGFYQLPQFVYVAGRDTARSNRVSLKVIPIKASADEEIAGFPDPVVPADKSIFDNLPDFIYYWWWTILLVLLLAAGAVWIICRKKENEPVLKKRKPEPTPYEVAMAGLRKLKDDKLWEQGLEREYFTRLTEILRQYLEGRFNINAMEMTSRQILDSLSSNPEVKGKRDYVRRILDMADFVKFAKMRPLPDDNIEAFTNAYHFIEETKPVVADVDSTESGEKKGGGK